MPLIFWGGSSGFAELGIFAFFVVVVLDGFFLVVLLLWITSHSKKMSFALVHCAGM